MNRLPDWPERLAELLTARLRTPFAWGTHDCALFAADAVQAQTGADPAAAWRGHYADEAGAQQVLAAQGGLAGVVTAALGAPLPSPRLAQRGDLVLLDAVGGPTLAVVSGAGRCAVPGPQGLAHTDLATARLAWKV